MLNTSKVVKDGVFDFSNLDGRESALSNYIQPIGPNRPCGLRPENSEELSHLKKSAFSGDNWVPEKVKKLWETEPVARNKSEYFGLPGEGELKDDCGQWRTGSLLKCSNHKHFKRIRDNCKGRPCPDCSVLWIHREVNRITDLFHPYKRVCERINQKEGCQEKYIGPLAHITLGAPPKDWDKYHKVSNIATERKKAKRYLTQVGFDAGVLVFHAERFHSLTKCERSKGRYGACQACKQGVAHGEWYEAPHWHAIGHSSAFKNGHLIKCWVDGDQVAKINKRTGWIIKNIGKIDSLSGVLWYVLSHASYWREDPKRFRSITRIGDFSKVSFKKTVGIAEDGVEDWVFAEVECPDNKIMHYYKSDNENVNLIDPITGSLALSLKKLEKFHHKLYVIRLYRYEYWLADSLGQDKYKVRYRAPYMPRNPSMNILQREQDLSERGLGRDCKRWWMINVEELDSGFEKYLKSVLY